MRIGLVSVTVSPLDASGGRPTGHQFRQVGELARELAGHGHDVRVYTRRQAPAGSHSDSPHLTAAPAAPARQRVDGVLVEQVAVGPAQPIPQVELMRHIGHFGQWLDWRWGEEGWRPDVVHAHCWLSGLAAVTGTRPASIPVVQTFHVLGSVRRRYLGVADRSPPERVGLERALGRAVDRAVAQCPQELAELTRLGLPREAVTVVPAGVDVTAFAPHGPRAPSDSGRPRLLAVGRPGLAAGFEDSIAALRLVPGAELAIVGGEPGEQPGADRHSRRLQAVAERAGVVDRVRFVGAVPPERMAEWYRSAAMLVATPRCPSFGLAAVEAMACGIPVVGYSVGGLDDSVVDGVTGRLVRAGEVAALATAVRQLLASGVDRLAYSEAAVDRARSRYGWNRVVAELELLYGDVAGVEMAHRTGALGSSP